jgi:divalent metal cation (Fe/Co/Zn/Cd) transporter
MVFPPTNTTRLASTPRAAVLLGLVLNAGLGWWWADPVTGYILVYYALREVRAIFSGDH